MLEKLSEPGNCWWNRWRDKTLKSLPPVASRKNHTRGTNWSRENLIRYNLHKSCHQDRFCPTCPHARTCKFSRFFSSVLEEPPNNKCALLLPPPSVTAPSRLASLAPSKNCKSRCNSASWWRPGRGMNINAFACSPAGWCCRSASCVTQPWHTPLDHTLAWGQVGRREGEGKKFSTSTYSKNVHCFLVSSGLLEAAAVLSF